MRNPRFWRLALAVAAVLLAVTPVLLGERASPTLRASLEVPVLANEQMVEVSPTQREGSEKSVEALAKIDTGATYSTIDRELARELDLDLRNARVVSISSAFGTEYRPMVPVQIRISGRILNADITVSDRSGMENPVLVGRADLDGFLIRVEEDERGAVEPNPDQGPDYVSALPVQETTASQVPLLTLLAALPLLAALLLVARVLGGLPTLGLLPTILLSLAFAWAGPRTGLPTAGAALALGAVGGVLLTPLQLSPPARLAVLLALSTEAALLFVALADRAVTDLIETLPLAVTVVASAIILEQFWECSRREGAREALGAGLWTVVSAAGISLLLVLDPVLRVAELSPFLFGAIGATVCLLVGLRESKSP
jgi:hypothetical protein